MGCWWQCNCGCVTPHIADGGPILGKCVAGGSVIVVVSPLMSQMGDQYQGKCVAGGSVIVVVSPLISRMGDQYRIMSGKCVAGGEACILDC